MGREIAAAVFGHHHGDRSKIKAVSVVQAASATDSPLVRLFEPSQEPDYHDDGDDA
jgi:hypothetical protein